MKSSTFLSIAGFDPSGGAGLICDSQIASYYSIPIVALQTCLTSQNSKGVFNVWPTKCEIIQESYKKLVEDIDVKIIKIGLLPTAEIAYEILEIVRNLSRETKIILDPIIKPTGSGKLIEKNSIKVIKKLVRYSHLITPNLQELNLLTDKKNNKEANIKMMLDMGARNILLTGIDGDRGIINELYGENEIKFSLRKYQGSYRGTGCALSSAIACNLYNDRGLQESIKFASEHINKFIKSSYIIGTGAQILKRS